MDSTMQALISIAVSIFLAVLAVPGAIKILAEFRHTERLRRRAESEFALKLSDRISDPNLDRYAVELAYAALVGDNHLSHKQRKILLAMQDSEAVIFLYSKVRRLVKIGSGVPTIDWRQKRHASVWYRKIIKGSYLFSYSLFAMLACAPILVHGFYPQYIELNRVFWVSQAIWGAYFLGVAFECVKSRTRLSRAETLMSMVNTA